MGRFITEDPIKDGENWYVYCGNNPIMLIDIIVKYGIENNGGYSSYYEESNFSYFSLYNKTISFNLNSGEMLDNGNVVGYFRVINGRCVADSEVVASAFGLTSDENLINQNYYGFDTLDDAAIAWGLENNSTSIIKNKELSSAIYLDGNKFKYTDCLVGTADNAPTPSAPAGYKLVGMIHSHGAYDPNAENERFSGTAAGDKIIGDTDTVDPLKIPMYLVTPGGYLKKYVPNANSGDKFVTVGNGFPRDAGSPI